MRITIWGNELPAWTAAAALAEAGNHVSMVSEYLSSDQELEFKASNEPGLQGLIQSQREAGRLSFSDQQQALQGSNNHIFALSPNQYPLAEQLTLQLKQFHPNKLLIINQSNFGVGSSDKLQKLLQSKRNQIVAYIPDMLAEGSALKNFKSPETLILGCEDESAIMTIRALLRPFSQGLKQWLIMSAKEAEFTKFANTGMLALRLGYINELANLADHLQVDIEVIRAALISDPRIGPHYLHPGCGFGGQHFQQYIAGLSELMSENRNSKLLDTVLIENEKQKEQPFRKLWRHYECDLQGKTITVWGLSFKPGTASIDNAPSLKIIETLLAQKCQIKLHDPLALSNIRQRFGDLPELIYCEDSYQALEQSDGLLLLTEWPEYWSPDYERILQLMRSPLVIDGRNIFAKETLLEQGFTYYGVGR
ncbi:nucleotide sugar dehydrogenase [Neptuniibacter halophilus]|uniref:nucleotide sugar dehydrogenase n=1 Tax=Neptuniibacter halophilus TaxID=651666 RepID=UPI002572AB5A|nr:nucleotide sugar dehydrogenase [Neptuniibacter halophilus]